MTASRRQRNERLARDSGFNHRATRISALYNPFERKQERRKQKNLLKVEGYREKIARVYESEDQHREVRVTCGQKVEQLTEIRDLTKHWVHVDLDMFFVAVEIRDRPDLADKPVAVENNTVIATANYIARRYEVHSGMPTFKAKENCNALVILQAGHHTVQLTLGYKAGQRCTALNGFKIDEVFQCAVFANDELFVQMFVRRIVRLLNAQCLLSIQLINLKQWRSGIGHSIHKCIVIGWL